MTISDLYSDTTVVLILTRPTQYLGAWLEAHRADPDLARSELVILYDVRASETVAEFSRDHPEIATRSLAGEYRSEAGANDNSHDGAESGDHGDGEADGRSHGEVEGDGNGEVDGNSHGEVEEADRAGAYRGLFDSLTTRYFCFTTLQRRTEARLRSLKAELTDSHSRVTSIGLEHHDPVLLHTRHDRSTAPRAWLTHAIGTGEQISPTLADYLGYLSLLYGVLSLEGVDPNDEADGIDLFARVSTGRSNGHLKPSWTYRLAVVGRDGVHSEAPAVLSQRVDNQGVRRWENLTATLSLAQVPDGNHRIKVGLDTEHPALRVWRGLTPRPGAIACARTFLTPSNARPGQAVTRYLVHAVRKMRQSWITVQRGTGSAGRRRWYRTLLRKDLRHILRDRRAGLRIRAARLVRMLTVPFFRRKSIWLIGERSDTAQDNGFHLFRHLRENYPDRDVYYILDTSSPHYDRVAHLGNVVEHSSAKHRFLMLHASVLANAYSVKHMLPAQWDVASYTRHIAWRVGAVRVYLKHGVNVSANSVKRGTGGYDMYLSVNPRETAALRESSGYTYQIVEAGMPRYDALRPGARTRTILFMPTWRRYLVPKLFGNSDSALVEFEGSTYDRFIRGLLGSERLHQMLEKYDYRLQFLPHYNLREQLSSFELSSPRTEMADTERNSFQELITGCDAFLTDHSSVHFDVAYLGTPMVYAHFDQEDYARGHASTSWFEHERDGFGPVTYDLDTTLDALEELLARDCAPDPFYTARVDAAFTYRDQDNCARVVSAIEELLLTEKVNP